MRRPQSKAGNLWLDQYFSALRDHFTSRGERKEAVRDAAQALTSLLEREPGYAREVRQLAVQCAAGVYNQAAAGDITALAGVAIDAELVSPDLATEPTMTFLLLTYEADGERLAGRRLDGLATLEQLAARRGDDQPKDPLYRFVKAREVLVRAELDELDRELELAAEGFNSCRTQMADLVGDGPLAKPVTDDFMTRVFGPDDRSLEGNKDGLASNFGLMCAQTYVGALLGCLRTGPTDATDDRKAVAAQLELTLSRYGLVYAASPFLLIDALSTLDPDDGERLITALEKARQTASEDLLEYVELAGLDPEFADELRRRVSRIGTESEYDDVSWRVALEVVRGRVQESAGNAADAEAAYGRASELAARTPFGLTKVCAMGAFATFQQRTGRLSDPLVSVFLLAIGATLDADPHAFDDLRFRALFDDAVAGITSWALAEPDALASSEGRLRLSVLLDLARRRRQPVADVFLALGAPGRSRSLAAEAHLALANTIDRITVEIQDDPDRVVLIRHSDEVAGFFLVVDGNGPSIWPSADLTASLEALDDAAERMVMLNLVGGHDAVADAARNAFSALPAEVQARLRRASVLLVVPDYRREVSVTPYELLHDGESYLMQSKVVARFTSVEHLASAVGTGGRPRRTGRALVTAAPNGIPGRVLTTAIPERDAVRDTLSRAGFDAPDIAPARLSADFYCDRLSYVDLVHVAAHGESAAGTEYVLLEEGRRLLVDDLSAAPAPWMPFMYLNTCQLARTRYLGGGQGRGLAHTCSELGAPAVIANTSDVLDEVSMVLAVGFYEASRHQAVGEALRRVRNDSIQAGFHPALVGRVVLFGDPFYELVPLSGEKDLPDQAAALLDGFLGLIEDEDERAKIWGGVTFALTAGTADARLVAAMGIVQLLQDQGAGAEQSLTIPNLTDAIQLADALRHPPAQALLRLLRSAPATRAAAASDPAEEWLRDAIFYLRRLEGEGEPWGRHLQSARASLRRITYQDQGISFTQSTPSGAEPVDVEAIANLLAGAQQAEEEKFGKVELRAREDDVDDIAWNAVVLGHPNRFEASAAGSFCRQIAEKLVGRGLLPDSSRAYAPEMLTGLLQYLWSTQKAGYLEPELADFQAAVVAALIDDIRDQWSPPEDGAAREALDGFPTTVDQTLAELDAMSWEEVAKATDERVAALGSQAIEILERLATVDPFAVASSAAYLTGVLAAKNTFSPLDGSVPEQIGEALTNAMWSLSQGNDERFYPYLGAGGAAVRARTEDELTRWRAEAT